MQIFIEDNYEAMCKKGSELIASAIKENPNIVLGLATGSTVVGVYKDLVEKYERKEIDFSGVTTFNLDEYVGINPDDEKSYHSYMKDVLFSKTNVDIKNTFFPSDYSEDYSKFEDKIEILGGIDLQVLGIGGNGHIGFNEPGSSFGSRTREITLTAGTIKDNARFFNSEDDVPKKAATMGMGTIMAARRIVFFANGEKKKDIVKKALQGSVTEDIPASVLQNHKNVIIILDKEAASELE